MQDYSAPKKTNGLLLLLLVILVAVAALIGYMLGHTGGVNNFFPGLNNPSVVPSSTNQSPNPQAGTPAVLQVAWSTPQKINNVRLFFSDTAGFNKTTAESGGYGFGPAYAEYYQVGKITNAPGEILFASVQYDGPSAKQYIVMKRVGSDITILQKYSPFGTSTPAVAATTSAGTVDADGMLIGAYTFDTSTSISDLDLPRTFVGENSRQILTLDNTHGFDTGTWWFASTPESFTPVFVSASVGQVYISTSTQGYYLRRGPLVGVYKLIPDLFLDNSQKETAIPQIKFNDGTTNTSEYTYTTRGGCGSVNYIATSDYSKNDLVAVGTTAVGDTIFALKDNEHATLKDLYVNFPTDPKLTYEQFLATRPLLFWYDPFGRQVELQNSRFVLQAECGKPVIYLYPKTTMPVSVKLYPQGGFTYSDPPYNAGWDVVAEPNGTLHIGFASSSYPFLFWEGRGSIYDQPKNGWVVARSNLKTFLTGKLRQLGLNAHESRDFMDYWLPKMQAKPYYFITFMGNKTMDTLAPLVIDPKPDTVIRVLMDFTALDKPIPAKPYAIYTPARKGFTVIEWGGVLR